LGFKVSSASPVFEMLSGYNDRSHPEFPLYNNRCISGFRTVAAKRYQIIYSNQHIIATSLLT